MSIYVMYFKSIAHLWSQMDSNVKSSLIYMSTEIFSMIEMTVFFYEEYLYIFTSCIIKHKNDCPIIE